jgi:AcrR family transcriptional regulator
MRPAGAYHPNMDSHDPASPRGRPRDLDADRRILDAALRLLGRDGYARMSLDAVAAEAGVTRPTIYRRYAGKADLAEAALAALAARRDESLPAETGDLRTDLVAHLRHFKEGVSRPFGVALVGTVLAEERETPGLLAMYRERIVGPRRRLIRGVLERAVARGGLRPGADLDAAVNALVGAFYAHYLVGAPFAADWEERVVETVVAGIQP